MLQTTITQEQLDRLAAQSGTGGAITRLPVLDRINLNGNADAVENEKGELKRPMITHRRVLFTQADKDERPEQINIGSEISVIFVAIRRKLVERDSRGWVFRSTSSHAHKDSITSLWEEGQKIAVGPASELRNQYPEMRTVQEVYSLYYNSKTKEWERVVVTVKGAAFGSETRDKQHPSFYEYIGQLTDGLSMNITDLGGVLEHGKKDFYTMTFTKGPKTTDQERLAALEFSDELTATFEKYDNQNAQALSTQAYDNQHAQALSTQAAVQEEKPEYPDGGGISPEDVPF